MHDAQLVKVSDPCGYLSNVVGNYTLIKGGISDYFIIEVALADFHDQIDFLLAKMIAVGWKYVRMLAKQVDFEFID